MFESGHFYAHCYDSDGEHLAYYLFEAVGNLNNVFISNLIETWNRLAASIKFTMTKNYV